MFERRQRNLERLSVPDAEIQERLDRGIDPFWHGFIRDRVAEDLQDINEETELIARNLLEGETIDDAMRRIDDRDLWFELLIAKETLEDYEEKGVDGTEMDVNQRVVMANELREKILSKGFTTADVVMGRSAIDEMELIRRINQGYYVVVADYDELLFPSFQFVSPEAERLVQRLGARQLKYQTPDPSVIRIPEVFNPWPSWARTAWWFGTFNNAFIEDDPDGQTDADMILAGRVREIAARLEIDLAA